MDKVLHIEGARAKIVDQPRYNIGNVPFELTINKLTEITDKGDRIVTPRQNGVVTATPVTWADVAEKEGEIIKIDGWVKFNIRESRHANNESTYGVGSITDGNKKLELRLTSLTNLPEGLVKCKAVTVTGTVCYTSYLFLRVESGANIECTDEEPMDIEEMLNVTQPLVKRRRID